MLKRRMQNKNNKQKLEKLQILTSPKKNMKQNIFRKMTEQKTRKMEMKNSINGMIKKNLTKKEKEEKRMEKMDMMEMKTQLMNIVSNLNIKRK